MYDVYLSHGLTKEYVRLLIEKGLMEYLDGERTFKTTDKGMNFLHIHHKVQINHQDGYINHQDGNLWLHSSEGIITIPYTFQEPGVYSVNVTLFGILFIPVNPESALFKLNVT
jgi:hypothetical protein